MNPVASRLLYNTPQAFWSVDSWSVTLLPMTDQQTQPDDVTTLPTPMDYHLELRDYLRSEHSDAWDWFASNPTRARHTESVRLALLRSTYRIERDADQSLYEIVDSVAGRMNLKVPVTV